ncbi:transposable element Tcb2 transposase [Trichonephila clavipes]|nr:transposable element Tcb2 transposase [Trichonephila clavipes]
MSQDCLHHITTFSCPAKFPDLSSIENIWDHLGWQVGQPTSLVELEACLQKLGNEMSHNITRNSFVSIPSRIASCNDARGAPTEY